jgi:hypothetical protein
VNRVTVFFVTGADVFASFSEVAFFVATNAGVKKRFLELIKKFFVAEDKSRVEQCGFCLMILVGKFTGFFD